MDLYTKALIDRHSQSSEKMCMFYCTQFIHRNCMYFTRIKLLSFFSYWRCITVTDEYFIV